MTARLTYTSGAAAPETDAAFETALEAARPSGGPQDGSDMVEALAEELGLSADKVEAALEGAMPSGRGPRGIPPDGGGAPQDDGVAPDGGDTAPGTGTSRS